MGPPHCEVQTVGLHTALHERGCALAYPRIDGKGLEFALVRNALRDLAPGPWKLREPKPHCELISIEAIDVLIVPGVAFTPYGERLGQGGGYYDRALADSTFSGCSIGLCFQEFVLPNLPTNAWDQRVDWIATEDGLVAATPKT
jgi:5-formyltetrahydrofolate cyclo-ligase